MSKIGAIERWRAWAGSLANRHRRFAVRTAGLSTVLASTRAASRTVRESWLLSSRTLQPRIHLSIQPLLRFDLRPAAAATVAPWDFHQSFDLRPAAAAAQILREIFHKTENRRSASHRIVERFRQSGSSGSSTIRILESSPPRLISEAPRLAPLSLVLQRLREPAVQAERRAPEDLASRPALAKDIAGHLARKVRREERPADTPAIRVLREDAQASRSDRAFAAADRERIAAPDPWRAMSVSSAATAAPGAIPAIPTPSVEVLTERVMHQIDQRLHAWRERRGGF